MHIVEYSIVEKHTILSMKSGAYNFVLPNISVNVVETVGEGEEGLWQPTSVISLQQSFKT